MGGSVVTKSESYEKTENHVTRLLRRLASSDGVASVKIFVSEDLLSF